MPWQVPGYRPREDLAGGSGRVVLAADESAGDLVVIKYLNADSSHTSDDDLLSAINDIGGLPDDYFVRIRELVQDSGHNAIVMDPVNGTTMRALIRDDGAFEPESALVVFRDILTGLTYAHALDIVHGDVSPENVMINADGRPIMLNAGAATWDPREPTLSNGVYLAPERWSGGPPTAAADVYAATVGFVESLSGEPPYWEDTDLGRLRHRHESEDLDMSGVPATLHDVVRAGMSKSPESRLAAAALLDLAETAAIAGYGRDWPDRGRDGVIQRVRSGRLPFGGAAAPDAGGDVGDTEDVANDDYYADVSSADGDAASDGSPPGSTSRDAAAADAVMAAAADIVAFAQLRDAAEADAIRAASFDEDLTEEEESAVAEIERLLFLDEPTAAAGQALSNDATDDATADATAGEPADVRADNGAAEVIAANAAAEHGASGNATAGDPETAQPSPSHAGSGTETSRSDAAEPDVVPAAAGATTRTDGRRPGWVVVGAVAAALVVAGLLAWAGVGLTGSGTRPAAAASNRPVGTTTSPTPAPSVSTPASAGVPPIGGTPTGTLIPPPPSASGTAPSASGTAPSSEPSTGASATSSTPPTLPLTGFEHPIRLMAAIAVAFILTGALLLYAGRRRGEASPGRRLRARTPASG